jgi:outer membrane protein
MKSLRHLIALIWISTNYLFAQTGILSLEDCIQIALENNSTIRTTINFNESADQDVSGSYSGILPTVSVSASTRRSKAGPAEDLRDVPLDTTETGERIFERALITQDGYTAYFSSLDLSINQTLYDGGEWWNAIKYAKSQKLSSDYYLKSTINSIVFDVQNNFFDLLKQQKLLEVNELAVQRSQDQLDKTDKMFELGAVAKVDVFRSRVNLGNDKIAFLTQKNLVLTAKNNLNLVMGRDPKSPLSITSDIELQPAYTNLDELTDQTLENNPELKSAAQDIKSEDIAVSRATSVLYPYISASFGYNRSNEELKRVYTGYDKNWSMRYGLSLSLNLFNGYRDMVNIQKSKLSLKNSKETFEETKRSLVATMVQLTDNYNSFLEIITINEENLEAAKEEYRLAEERYRIGSGTALEVREAQVNLTRAEQILVAAQYNARITQARIEQTLGSILRG